MYTMPLVSVVIPVYNQAPYIEQTIQSVIAQTYSNYELIIVDDASTDGTDKIIAEFADDPKVSIYRNEKNLECARTRNLGYSKARGIYCSNLDSDDTLEQEYLEKCVDGLERHPDAAFVYTRVNKMDSKGGKKPRLRDRIPHRQNYYGSEFENIVKWLNHIPHASTLVRKSCAMDVGLYDPNLTAGYDWEFMMRLTKKYPALFINEHLYNLRIHRTNVTKNRIRKGEREGIFFDLLDRVYQMNELPERLLREKNMIYARAYLDIAEGYREIGDYGKMRRFFKQALRRCKNPGLYLPYRRLVLSFAGWCC